MYQLYEQYYVGKLQVSNQYRFQKLFNYYQFLFNLSIQLLSDLIICSVPMRTARRVIPPAVICSLINDLLGFMCMQEKVVL